MGGGGSGGPENPNRLFRLVSGLEYRFVSQDGGELESIPADPEPVSLDDHRQGEREEILRLLDQGSSIVAALGFPGVGKTVVARYQIAPRLKGQGQAIGLIDLDELSAEGTIPDHFSVPRHRGVLIIDEAVIDPKDWEDYGDFASGLRTFVEDGGKIILMGANGYWSPARQQEWLGWVERDVGIRPAFVTFKIKPLNTGQAAEWLVLPHSPMTPSDRRRYAELVLRWVPPHRRLLTDFILPIKIASYEEASRFFQKTYTGMDFREFLAENGIHADSVPPFNEPSGNPSSPPPVEGTSSVPGTPSTPSIATPFADPSVVLPLAVMMGRPEYEVAARELSVLLTDQGAGDPFSVAVVIDRLTAGAGRLSSPRFGERRLVEIDRAPERAETLRLLAP